MPKRTRIVLLASLLAALLLSAACAVDRQIEAVERAVEAYGGSYFELDDLPGQLAGVLPQRGEDGTLFCTLAVRVPDYTKLNYDDVPFAMPPTDFDNADLAAYRLAFIGALRDGAERYARTRAAADFVGAELRFNLTRIDGRWSAAVDNCSEQALDALVDGMISQIADTMIPSRPEFRLIEVAEHKDEVLSWVFEGAGLLEATRLENVRALDDSRYELTVSYPSPELVYTYLGDELYRSYAEPVFGSVSVRLVPDEMDAAALMQLPYKSAALVVRYRDGAAVPEDDSALWRAFYDAKLIAEQETRARIEKDWLLKPQPHPKSGVVEGIREGNPVLLDLTGVRWKESCFVRFLRAEAVFTDKSNALALSVFVENGEKAAVRLPAGEYRVELHYGVDWYGPQYAFGPAGTAQSYPDVLTVVDGQSVTLALAAFLTGG